MATSNAELQAEIDRIMRMAVRLEPVDLRYDVNKDGRISSRDAYLVMSGAATIPPPPAPAPVVQQPWWVGQFASEADANFVDTNRNQQIEETERAAWRSQYDPNSTEYQQRVSQEQEAARQEAARQEAARQAAIEQERLIQQQLLNQNTRSAAAAVGVNLPQNWFDLNSKQKADWFVANKVTEDQLTRAGVPASELQALKDVGYYDVPAMDAAVEKERLSQQQLLSNAGEYIDPVTGKNYTTELSNYLTSQLNALGITSASQIEKRIIKGDPEKVELGPTEYLFELPTGEYEGTTLYRSGPDGFESVNLNEYEIGQRQAAPSGGDGFGGYTTVAARRKNIIPATPDVTKYYNKNTGQEITNQILFDDKVGTKYVLTDQGVQKQFDPTTRLSFQLAQYVDPSSTGGAWGTASGKSSGPGFGPEGMLRQLAQRFINLTGLTDLNKLGVRTTTEYHEAGNMVYVPVSVETYYDKDTGREIGFNGNLGGWAEGPGMTYANILFDDNGKPIIRTWGKDSNSVGDLLPILSMVLMAIPGIGQAVGSALLPTGVSVATATAVGNAVINAGLQVASGVPVEKAILNSAASLGVSQLVPNLSGNVYVDNAVRSVATAALTGGDVGNALANSLIATGGNELLGNTSFTGDKVVDSAIASAITSGVQAAATDGDVGASIIRGGIAGASGQLTKEEKMAESAKSGAGFIGEDVTEPTSVAEPGIDPRILAQGVTGDQFGEGGFLQTGGNIGVNVLPPNPQSEFGVQKNINARADFNESSLGAKYGEINSPHWGKLISSIMINDVVDSNGNPIDTPVGYYAIYDPDTKSTFYEFSLSDGTTVTSKTRPFVEQGKIFSEDKFFELKPSRQPSELNIDTGAGNGAFLGGTEDLVEEPVPGITISASKPIIDQRLLDLVEQAPDQESATNAAVAYYQALDNDLSDDEALNAAKTAMQAKSPQILFGDSVVEQKPTEQQVPDTELTVVDQPVNQTPVVSPTTPSVTPPTIAPVVTEPVVTEPVVTQPSVTQPVVSEPVAQQPTAPDIVTTTPSITQPAQKTELQAEIDKIMRMAVKKETADLRYDVNKDGRINSRDAYLVYAGQATIPTAEEYAAQQSASYSTAPSTTPQVTQPVDQTPAEVTPTTPPLVIEPTPPTSEVTGIVLQNNGDGTALVLTNDGNAANVPVTDAVSNEPLTPGSSVTIDQNTNTATATPPASNVEEPVLQEPTSPPQPPPAVPTTPEEPITEPPQEPVVSVPPTVQDTGDQQILGGGQQPTTDAGSIIDTPIGTDTSTPTVTPGFDVNVNPNVNVDEPIPPVDEFPPVEDRLPPLPPPVKTEEDLLLEQIIRELEPTPPVSEGVPIPEPVFPEPPLVLPESPTINVGDRLTVRPVVDRGYRRPSVSPGSRVEESAQILPLRPGLSEGGTGGIEGTTEQEQEPVWNVRSLKLRRLLGI